MEFKDFSELAANNDFLFVWLFIFRVPYFVAKSTPYPKIIEISRIIS